MGTGPGGAGSDGPAEGAGAAPVAAAVAGLAGEGNIVCVVSGGNIDASKLIPILQGHVP